MAKIALTKEKKDLIVAQALRELFFDRKYKQGKIKNWQLNESMYYTKVIKQAYASGLNYGNSGSNVGQTVQNTSRSNVNLASMQDFVHTLQSKTNTPLIFKFKKKYEAQMKRVKRLNALKDVDREKDNWDIKFSVANKQVFLYGKAIFCYYADSYDGYKAHLDNVDVYDWLVDPSGFAFDLETKRNMGRYGVVYTTEELQTAAENGDFDKEIVDQIIQNGGNNTETPQEETNKLNRMYAQNTIGKKELQNEDKFKFWEWYTTWFDKETGESNRYYLLLQERAGRALEVCDLRDKFAPTKEYPKGAWPFWDISAYPDMTEYWTPSPCDYVREIFMAQDVSINQMLDNAEAINKPMRKVQVGAIENMAELKYRRDGIIKVKGDIDVNKAYQIVTTPSIDTPLKVYEKLEQIAQNRSGVTDEKKGLADTDGTLGIYEGNKQEADDLFELYNTSQNFGVKRFAKLYELGVREHLTKKIAVELIGNDGVETEEISKRDIFKKDDTFTVMVEAADSERKATQKIAETKIKFLDSQLANQRQPGSQKIINAKKAFEMEAKIAGFTQDDIKELMDTSEYGNGELLSEASLDIENLLDGQDVQPNQAANNAYKQKIVDYMVDHQEDIKPEMFARFVQYVESLKPIVERNEARSVIQYQINMQTSNPGMGSPATPPGGAPMPPPQPPMPPQGGQIG